jgi:hypothetical protein
MSSCHGTKHAERIETKPGLPKQQVEVVNDWTRRAKPLDDGLTGSRGLSVKKPAARMPGVNLQVGRDSVDHDTVWIAYYQRKTPGRSL